MRPLTMAVGVRLKHMPPLLTHLSIGTRWGKAFRPWERGDDHGADGHKSGLTAPDLMATVGNLTDRVSRNPFLP